MPPQCRRSLFGYFCHRCFVSFTKLSLGGVERLFHDFIAWIKSDSDPRFAPPSGYAPIRRDVITNGKLSLSRVAGLQEVESLTDQLGDRIRRLPVVQDETRQDRLRGSGYLRAVSLLAPHFQLGINITMVSFMKGLVTGDSNVANDGLRRFFEQKFHEGNESYVAISGLVMLAY